MEEGAMTEETPADIAARINIFLRNECEGNRDPEDYLGYFAIVFEPENETGEITYCSNVPRPKVLQFMKEFTARTEPARGRK